MLFTLSMTVSLLCLYASDGRVVRSEIDQCPKACDSKFSQFEREVDTKILNLSADVTSLKENKRQLLTKIDHISEKYGIVLKSMKALKLKTKKIWKVAKATRKKCLRLFGNVEKVLNETQDDMIRYHSMINADNEAFSEMPHKNISMEDKNFTEKCADKDGVMRRNDEEWYRTDSRGYPTRCVCDSRFFSPKLYESCRLLGCERNGAFYKPEEISDDCQCVIGTDENIMDGYTLYHWKCMQRSEDECVDKAGNVRKRGVEWDEVNSKGDPLRCMCDQLYFDPTLFASCKIVGCEYRDQFYSPGKTRPYLRHGKTRSKCKCIKGTDPLLMDDFVLYHWACDDGVQPEVNATESMCIDKNGMARLEGDIWDEYSMSHYKKCRCEADVPHGFVIKCAINGCMKDKIYFQLGEKYGKCTCATDKSTTLDLDFYTWKCNDSALSSSAEGL